MATCALVAASDFNRRDFERRLSLSCFDSIIAVDGGYGHLQRTGCEPSVTIGDFDSLGYVPEGPNVKTHPTHKDKSDLELALDYAISHGFSNVFVYGALGGRLDHSVGNLQLCASFAERGLDMLIVDVSTCVKVLVGPATYRLPDIAKGTVSVFSAKDVSEGVCIAGMEYPLDNATLANRTTLGLSNELVGAPASVTVQRGTLYIFHPCENDGL